MTRDSMPAAAHKGPLEPPQPPLPSRGRGGIESGRGSPSALRRGGRGKRRRKGGAGGEAALKAAVAARGGGLTSGSKGPAVSRVPRGWGEDPRGDRAPLWLVLGARWPWVRRLSVGGSVCVASGPQSRE